MRTVWPLVPLTAVAAVIGVEAFLIAGAVGGFVLVSTAVLIASGGVMFVVRTLPSEARATSMFVGPIFGFGAAVALMLLAWAAGVPALLTLLLGPALLVLAGLCLRARVPFITSPPKPTRRDACAVGCALLVVPLITAAPYLHVRSQVPEGEAYRAYFTADFVWAMAAAAEISKGDVPPVNPFHHTEPMRYYWMSHLLSGIEYRAFQPVGIAIEPILLVNGLCFGAAFVALLYWLTRAAGASAPWAAAAVAVAFLANSYEGSDMLRAILTHHDDWEALRNTNIDAVSRWFYKGMAVDGLHRLLLYQPHHLTGYAMGLTAVALVAAADVTSVFVALAAGILVALAVLFSTFTALIIAVAVALLYLLRIAQGRAWTLLPQSAVLCGGPFVLAVLLTQKLGYTSSLNGGLMTLGVNPVATHLAAWVLFLSCGPLLLIGGPALARLKWLVGKGAAPLALTLAATAFYFLVDVADMGGVWVGWRSGHVLLIALTLAAGAGVTQLWPRVQKKALVGTVLAIVVLLAVPTVAIDVFNAQDIDNRREGAGFPWTLIVTPAERQAFDWIRTHTAPDAVIQAEPFARDPATWAYVPAFAERRMAAGLPISMIPHRPYAYASDTVRSGIFKAPSPQSAHEWALYLAIDYLLIGDRERQTYRAHVEQLLNRSDLFEAVFHNDAVVLLKVVKPATALTAQGR